MSLLSNTIRPSGSRRLSLGMLAIREQADQFAGVPRGTAKPLRYLMAFQAAEPYLGLPPQAYKLVAWLVTKTFPQDWEKGSRPIAWPSAASQAEFLGVSPARVKILNRILFEAGIFVIRDSETGKRYGSRDKDGKIIEAYGFDLSPLAYRQDEFIRIAAEATAERDRMKALRKRATRARRAIRSTAEMLQALDALPSEWIQLQAETRDLVDSIQRCRRSDDLAVIVKGLESRCSQVEAWAKALPSSVDTSPQGPENKPHNISTNRPSNFKDTVVASEESNSEAGSVPSPSNSDDAEEASVQSFEQIQHLHPAELARLAPRLSEFLPRSAEWRDVVEAAGGYLRHELGISQPLWGEACLTLGRERAAIAMAIVSTKPEGYFARGAGGYFAAMVKRARTGELHLDRSLWKLRRERLAL